jgi:hypothetical protein
MSKYIKGLYGKTESVLNESESLTQKVAALLGVSEEEIAPTVEGLTFSDYLALGNAVDVEDVAAANEILGVQGLEEADEYDVEDAPSSNATVDRLVKAGGKILNTFELIGPNGEQGFVGRNATKYFYIYPDGKFDQVDTPARLGGTCYD